MNKVLRALLLILSISMCISCGTRRVSRGLAWAGMYEEKPLTIAVMPVINHTTEPHGAEEFQSVIGVYLAECGYYVCPPEVMKDVMRIEGLDKPAKLIDKPLTIFHERLGVDAVLFTRIKRWEESVVNDTKSIAADYVLLSTKTNRELFRREIDITESLSGISTNSWIMDLIIDIFTRLSTRGMKMSHYTNYHIFKDMPEGYYSPRHLRDRLKEIDRRRGGASFLK